MTFFGIALQWEFFRGPGFEPSMGDSLDAADTVGALVIADASDIFKAPDTFKALVMEKALDTSKALYIEDELGIGANQCASENFYI